VRRWLWLLIGLVTAIAVVVVVVVVSRDDGSDSVSPTTTTTTTTTTETPTASTVLLPPITNDPQSFAEFLFAAWRNGNRTAAAEVATPEAVDKIFARPYSAQSQWALGLCDPAAGSLYCTWNGTNGAQLVITVRTLTGGLPIKVMYVQFQTS
jgi:hypothetical protein